MRVRVDLTDRRHADASRIPARLLLAKFTASVAVREDRSLFACLVLDDTSRAVTREGRAGYAAAAVGGRAAVVLALRTLDEVPAALRGPLLGAVGCRVVLSGLTAWDGQQFAEAWGQRVDRGPGRHRPADRRGDGRGKAWHLLRQAISGKAPTQRAGTVRQVERERWSASELAHSVPAGHAVLSLTSVSGDRTSPLLVDLRGR